MQKGILYLWIIKNSKIYDPQRLLLNLTDKIDLRRKDIYIPLSYLSIHYAWKI